MTVETIRKENWFKPAKTLQLNPRSQLTIGGPAFFSFLTADPIERVLVVNSPDRVTLEDRHIPEQQGMLHKAVGNTKTKIVGEYSDREINEAKLKVKPPLISKKLFSLVMGKSTKIVWRT